MQLGSLPGTPRTAGTKSNFHHVYISANILVLPFSRTSSGNPSQSRIFYPQSPRPTKATTHRPSISPPARGVQSPMSTEKYAPPSPEPAEPSSPAAEDSTTSESDSSDGLPAQSRILRRPARFQSHKQPLSKSASSADESPAFLPFTPIESHPSTTATHHDPSATLRGDPRQISRRAASKKSQEVLAQNDQTSDSSASSAHQRSNSTTSGYGFESDRRIHGHGSHRQRPTGPLSPRRTAELAGRSSGRGREGSDGTPSMGSSFSDLDGEFCLFYFPLYWGSVRWEHQRSANLYRCLRDTISFRRSSCQ